MSTLKIQKPLTARDEQPCLINRLISVVGWISTPLLWLYIVLYLLVSGINSKFKSAKWL
ncbi:hypothetical protein [Thalassomonas actiniarum]|uniref:Uncharacterized protein n=1 Tax=Thalassomonas actiniarum TaxID=485447 RepID=A0AAE9YVX6_9GAMM|nr:hypothetical protein [Thalassomonas actiniarum]WDE02166.1 hypothetical protein SG35_030895 [Thalassomonas actiniarum]